MAQRLDWPRYSRWTWTIAIIVALVLLLMWLTGHGPGAAGACCNPAVPVAAAPAEPSPPATSVPAVAEPSAVLHKAMWDGQQLTLEGVVPNEASKKAIVDAAVAKYGAANVVDKLTLDAAAVGPITVTLLGTVARDAVKTERGEEAKAFYTNATVDNQLVVQAPMPAAQASDVQCSDNVAVAATFATGSADLTREARKLLDAVVPCITGAFEVGGHTDNVGKAESNQLLSERRAASVAKYLVSKGVDAKLLTTKGYGDTAPIADNGSTAGKASNRRIEFKKQ
jgi:outer membrane protein OmpA-like peptidoglycan-associated protein